jgi:hypothetical protein
VSVALAGTRAVLRRLAQPASPLWRLRCVQRGREMSERKWISHIAKKCDLDVEDVRALTSWVCF